MKPLIIFILLCLLKTTLAFPSGTLSGADDRVNLFKEGKSNPKFKALIRSVVRLEGECSGVAISPKYLLTAGHCFNSDEKIKKAYRYSSESKSQQITLKPRFSLRVKPLVDLALYERVGKQFKEFIPLDWKFDPNEKSLSEVEFYIAGFPTRGDHLNKEGFGFFASPATSLGYEDPFMFAERVQPPPFEPIPPRMGTYASENILISLSTDAYQLFR